ncbi:LemA family protein [candidate division WOR-3 bacterium]|uniref:LemA family protein n=1 Tax=candidate division TA06 bacterium TaxID=2250710 RepID=A0A660S8Y2_UNCT6|nr:LemA family protein [candidate division WOR-3 bacterium]RKX66726.1 MAG: LemA family protein [candidate division TA06 bacterium]
MVAIIVLIVIIVLIIMYIVGIYNTLVASKVRIDNAWASIDVQLKRRYDLIPNLVNAVKGYMEHEKEIFIKVTQARSNAMNANGVAEKAKAEGELTNALKSLFAVMENYPNIKANENMMQLQEELTSTENKISFARQHYNDVVAFYNTLIQKFPQNIIAGMFNFTKREFFKLENEEEREAPKVKF